MLHLLLMYSYSKDKFGFIEVIKRCSTNYRKSVFMQPTSSFKIIRINWLNPCSSPTRQPVLAATNYYLVRQSLKNGHTSTFEIAALLKSRAQQIPMHFYTHYVVVHRL